MKSFMRNFDLSKALRNNFKLSALLLELELQSGGNISFEEVEKENPAEPGNNEIPTGKSQKLHVSRKYYLLCF